MIWLDRWRPLAARIDGLIRAGEFLALSFNVHSNDTLETFRKSLAPELKAITDEIDQFGRTDGSELPPKAIEALKRYLAQDWHSKVARATTGGGTIAIQVLAPLAAFRSEFEYLIRDAEVEGRSLTELAFEHLRRLLVVDEVVRKKWEKALGQHETACERLGAVHLLSHGIWAFKVVAPGAATDLVYGEPVEQCVAAARRIARAFVLTEWKVIKNPQEIDTKAEAARKQAAIYSGGVLGDVELKRTRYIVLVSRNELASPGDVADKEITYRHVVIPVKPKSPSKAARSKDSNEKPK
jgi:hypothetical protein